MPDTQDFAIFVRVVELGSLSAAGRDMRLSAAVISNRIARLEKDVGIRLLNRTTRRVNLTEEGSRYYDHCVVILNELEQAESAITSATSEPRGPIKVSAPAVFGRLHVAPHVPRFLERYPQMQVRLHLTDALVDLVQERVDLAIRIAALSDSTSIVRTLAPPAIVAAPVFTVAAVCMVYLRFGPKQAGRGSQTPCREREWHPPRPPRTVSLTRPTRVPAEPLCRPT